MRGTLTAAWLAVSGLSASGVNTVFAATGGDPATLGDFISAGGSFSAAGALIYIVKKMTDGQLVARDPARVEAQADERLATAQRQLDAAHQREVAYNDIVRRLAFREDPT